MNVAFRLGRVLAFAAVLAVSRPAASQQPDPDEATLADQHALYYGVHMPEERGLSRAVMIASQMLAEQRYAESLPVLVRVMHAPEDALPTYGAVAEDATGAGGHDLPLSLKSRVAQIIKQLPPEGQRAYELEVRAESERKLAAALQAGRRELREVVANYPATEASRLALWVLAQRALENRDFSEAETCLDRLLETSVSAEQREQILAQRSLARLASLSAAELSAMAPERRDELEASLQNIPAYEGSPEAVRAAFAAADRPGAWLVAGGGPRHNPVLPCEPPHLWARWSSAAAALDGWVAAASLSQDEMPQANAASPLVVGDWVVVRGRDRLEGIHRQTGKLVWQRELPTRDDESPASHQLRRMQGDAAYLKNALRNESRDAISARTSSDGRLVYVVAASDHAAPAKSVSNLNIYRFGARTSGSGPLNQIVAVDAVAEGKLRWRTSDSEALEGYFFLDCPLVLGDRLFVLAEQEQAICLLQLDPGTGQLQWQQTIATVDSPVQEEAMRRMVGGCLGYADGRILCSTGVGLVAAVDPLRRTLEWVYRFPVEGGVQLGRSTPWGRRGSDRWPRDAGRQWLWNQLVAADGRVFVGSPESRRLHCIDLATGEEQWTASNSWPQLLCAADDQTVIVARPDAVIGVNAADGKTRWTTRTSAGAHPTGRGAWFQGEFLLPLSSGEVMLVRPEDGELASALRAGPEGVLGNLAFDGDSIYSQSFCGVARYDAAAPQGAPLLAEAERALVEGRLEQAVDLLLQGRRQDASASVFAERIRELASRQEGLPHVDEPRAALLEQLYQGRPSPPLLRQERLEAAVASKDSAAVLREAAQYCQSPGTNGLVAVSEDRALSPLAMYRRATQQILSADDRARLEGRLLTGAGPNERELIGAVLGGPDLVNPRGVRPDRSPDRRWASWQVGFEVRPRVDRVRRRNRGRSGSNLGEFELPLIASEPGPRPPHDRYVMSTAGELLVLSDLGEIRSQIELSKSSPERLMRLVSDDEPVAGQLGSRLFISTGDDILSIDRDDPEAGAVWSAKRSLQQVELQGPAANTAALAAAARAAAQRELRLIGVSPRGITIAGRGVVACLEPSSGRLVWLVRGVGSEAPPTADDQFVYSGLGEDEPWRLDLATGAPSEHRPPSGEPIATTFGRVATLTEQEDGAVVRVIEQATGGVLLEVALGAEVLHSVSGTLLSLLDADGQLRVVDLQGGESGVARLVVSDKLLLDAAPVAVIAEEIGGRLLVGVNLSPPHVHRAAGASPLDVNPIQTGPLYCFDLSSGERAWRAPAQIAAKGLLARHPPASPLVLLAATVESRDATGRYDSVHLVAIDIFSGRTVRRERGPRDDKGRQYRIQFNEGPRPYCLVTLDDSYLMLAAADAPTPPGPPAVATAEESLEGNLWNVGRAIGRLLGDGLGESSNGDEDSEPEDDD